MRVTIFPLRKVVVEGTQLIEGNILCWVHNFFPLIIRKILCEGTQFSSLLSHACVHARRD